MIDCIAALEAGMDGADGAQFNVGEPLRGRIQVIGNQAAHGAARATLRTLRSMTTPQVRSSSPGSPPGPCPLGPRRSCPPPKPTPCSPPPAAQATSIQRVPFDRATVIGSEARTAFVSDYDVEVAQAAMGADPVVSVVRSGLMTRVMVSPGLDGASFVVRIEGRDGVLQSPMETIALPGWEGAEIELPECSTSLFASSGQLVSGEPW